MTATQIKQQIKQGTEMVNTYNEYLQKTDELKNAGNDRDTLLFLLDIQELDFKDRVNNINSRLSKLNQDYTVQFETESAEANMNLDELIKEASKYVGKEPLAFTSKIQPLFDKIKPFMDQENKNAIYFELKGHVNFLKNTYKNK